jgi:hypothetical protein
MESRHGCPKVQINDNGREFVNSIGKELHRLTGKKQRLTSAYHPQANGLVERENRTIKERIRKSLMGDIHRWPDVLESAMFSIRTTKHATTGFSPFFLLYNREPVLPLDVRVDDSTVENDETITATAEEIEEKEMEDHLNRMLALKEAVEDVAMKNIKKKQIVQKMQYDRRHNITDEDKLLQPGSKVLRKRPQQKKKKSSIENIPWSKPVVVKGKLKNSYAVLEDSVGNVEKEHVRNLKLYYTNDDSDVEFVAMGKADRRFYNPVNSDWQKLKCQLLNIPYPRPFTCIRFVNKIEIDQESYPCGLEPIIPDGNCWFRAISYVIFGSQEHHALVMEKVVSHTKHELWLNSANDFLKSTVSLDEMK